MKLTYPSFYLIASIALAVQLTSSGKSHAQNAASTPETKLPEVVVTANADPSLTARSIETARQAVSQIPGGASVVDSEEYKRGRAANLRDALDFTPGVYIQPRFGAEESRISIRGSGIQRTFHGRGIKLLQDGAPLNLADGGFDFQSVEPLAARYIEVYRGANALQYGSTTLGGAINFVSYSGYNAPLAATRLELGSFGTVRSQVSSGWVSGNFDGYLSLSQFATDGFREHSQQNNLRLFSNFGYKLTPNLETRFYITAVRTDSELPGNLTKEQLETDPEQAQRNAFVKRFDYVDSNWKRDFELFRIANQTTWQEGEQRLTLSTFWSHKDLDHPILFVIDQLSNDFGANLRYDNTGDLFGSKNRFTVGFSPTFGIVQDNRFNNDLGRRGAKFADNDQTSSNFDFYTENEFYFLENAAFVIGQQTTYAYRDNKDNIPATRSNPNNSDTQDWWGFSPKVGLLWDITPTAQAFTNLSRSFEPPSFGELTDAANRGQGLVKLDAQTATTFEIGTRGSEGRFKWDVAWYHAWLDNELLEFAIQPGLTQTVNAGRTIHQGIEAGLDVRLWDGLFLKEAEDSLTLRQVYLWNDFRFDNDRQFGDNALPGVPQHYYRAELLYELPSGFYAGPNVEWVPQKYNVDSAETLFADPYALVGFKVGYRTLRGFSVFLEARNLTDKKYAATTGVISRATSSNQAQFLPGDGRSFYGGIEWRW